MDAVSKNHSSSVQELQETLAAERQANAEEKDFAEKRIAEMSAKLSRAREEAVEAEARREREAAALQSKLATLEALEQDSKKLNDLLAQLQSERATLVAKVRQRRERRTSGSNTSFDRRFFQTGSLEGQIADATAAAERANQELEQMQQQSQQQQQQIQQLQQQLQQQQASMSSSATGVDNSSAEETAAAAAAAAAPSFAEEESRKVKQRKREKAPF